MGKENCTYCDLGRHLAIHYGSDLRSTVNVLLSYVFDLVGPDAADILVVEEGQNVFRYAGGRGFRTNAYQQLPLAAVRALAGQALEKRGTVEYRDLKRVRNDSVWTLLVEGEGFVHYLGVPLAVEERVYGVLELHFRSSRGSGSKWLPQLSRIAEQGAIAIGNVLTVVQLRRETIELAQSYDQMIETWARALELHEQETKGHNQRVMDLTVQFARVLGSSETELHHIRRGALLHDVGKLAISENILFKPAALTDEERVIVQRHPEIAYELLSPVEVLRPALVIPYCHHERWDGSGYPRGLKEEEIPYPARVFAIVDVWDALRSHRPDRRAWPEDKARSYISEMGGRQFDPHLADRFIKLLDAGNLSRKNLDQELTREEYRVQTFSG